MTHSRTVWIGLVSTLALGPSLCLSQTNAVEKKAVPPPTAKTAKPAAKPKAKPKPSLSDDGPKVLSAQESADRSKRLSTLNGEDRYSNKVDWTEIPPWKQVGFYGVRSVAQTVVYVVDCSESMADGDRLLRAKRELRRSVANLQFPQRFMVIFYNDEPLPMPGGFLKSAEISQKDRLNVWLRTIEPDGGTDPRLAMRLALGLNPDAVFLLSDGAFPSGATEEIVQANKKKIPVHCVDLAGGRAGDHLKRIANESGGTYVSRP